jgi:Bacterial alpha-L-rhamnosidase C-terminal domain/Bacterial alpha-L-rhamnosidase 6 hairpin glycosidase domain
VLVGDGPADLTTSRVYNGVPNPVERLLPTGVGALVRRVAECLGRLHVIGAPGGRCLERGATTVWEEWDGVDEHGRASESLNHYSKGAVIGFLHECVAGLRQDPASAAWRRFIVEPVIGGDLTHARLERLSPRGRIGIEWKIEGTTLHMRVSVPPTSTATIILPDGSAYRSGPGDHCYQSSWPGPEQPSAPFRAKPW